MSHLIRLAGFDSHTHRQARHTVSVKKLLTNSDQKSHQTDTTKLVSQGMLAAPSGNWKSSNQFLLSRLPADNQQLSVVPSQTATLQWLHNDQVEEVTFPAIRCLNGLKPAASTT